MTSCMTPEFVQEMAAIPGGSNDVPLKTPYEDAVVAKAAEVWERRGFWSQDQKRLVEQNVTVKKLVEISRWAKQQTEQAQLPQGWVDNIPMAPVFRLFHEIQYLFLFFCCVFLLMRLFVT